MNQNTKEDKKQQKVKKVWAFVPCSKEESADGYKMKKVNPKTYVKGR